MINSQESIEFFVNLKRSLSATRFAGYHSGGSELDAFAKYLWNIQLCEALCPCFQLLEVAFRNKVHFQVGVAIKDPAWILNQHKIIGEVFPNMPRISRTRGDASIMMNEVRKLRNAALHHHSIWHWNDLKDRHNKMSLLIGYICTPSATTAKQIDRFPAVHSTGMSDCQKNASRILASVQKT